MTSAVGRTRVRVLSAAVDVLTWDDAILRLHGWAIRRESRYACITNVHSVVTADRDPSFGSALRQADMVTPDGAPVAWMLRKLGHAGQARINGPDLMWKYCAHASNQAQSIFLYGNTTATLEALQRRLAHCFPALQIAGAESPPFRALTDAEDAAVVDRINSSGAGTVWVSLGCPKQEFWMAAHRGRINAPMVGVGAAFDYHAGTIRRAPAWMQQAGLEWLHRLATEPRRLWRRYLVTNSIFLLGAVRQLWRNRWAR